MNQLEQPPMAFLSYSHRDNQYPEGVITALSERISLAVELQTGRPFNIFFDRKDIQWGENWGERIVDSIDEVTFFIPVISPTFLSSEFCKNELTQFLKRENILGRNDLIFPIYWRGKHLDEPDNYPEYHDVIRDISSHQWVDWRNLRHSKIDNPSILRQIDSLAEHIECALLRSANTAKSRSSGESAVHPRSISKGLEQVPLGNFLYPACGDDPRFLLESAMNQKKEGHYEAAKQLHEKMLRMGIDWSHDVGLFVDQLYFAISLHDKLEAWDELDALERHVFLGAFARIRPLITTDAYNTMRTMYQSSMSLSMLRQLRISDAYSRIEEVLTIMAPEPHIRSESQLPQSVASASILYANALMTRALVLHAKWSLGGHDRSDLTTAQADVNAAETIYRNFAHMGQPNEFHHLGRFYGTRAFLRIAEWDIRKDGETLWGKVLLDDAQHAHQGDNRTAYGRIAGQYCEAYCHFRNSEVESDLASKQAHQDSALSLLKSAEKNLDKHACFARVKITGLAAWIANQGNSDVEKRVVDAVSAAHQQALAALPDRSLIEGIPLHAWLGTPLN